MVEQIDAHKEGQITLSKELLFDQENDKWVKHLAPHYKKADVDATASGNTQVVAAVTGKRIRVVGVIVTNKNGSLATVKFQTATTDITAAHGLAASGGGYTRNKAWPEWVMQTAVGEALNINLAGNGAVGCDVEYWEVA